MQSGETDAQQASTPEELNRKPSMSTLTQIYYPLVFSTNAREGVSARFVVVGPLSTPEGSNRPAPTCVRFDPSGVSTVCCALTPDFIRGYSDLCPPESASSQRHISHFPQHSSSL